MAFRLTLAPAVEETLAELTRQDQRKLQKVVRTLEKLEADPRHPGLASHRFDMIKGALGEPIWESYVENNTPSAWRAWWYYGPDDGEITVVMIGPHP
jgi:hypothetical protein